MDILDIFLYILLKPPQPLMGLFLITGYHMYVGSQKMPFAFWFKGGGYLTDGCTCQMRMQSRSYRQTVQHNYLTPAHFNVETMMAQLNPGAREYDHQAGALRNVNNQRGMRSPTDAMEIRNWYKTYFFNAVGVVPFQIERISYM